MNKYWLIVDWWRQGMFLNNTAAVILKIPTDYEHFSDIFIENV